VVVPIEGKSARRKDKILGEEIFGAKNESE
jgi:hypothetical protein